MTVLIIGSVLLGAILGQFFKVLVIAPVAAAVFAALVVRTIFIGHSAETLAVDFAVSLIGLQIGYASLLFPAAVSALWRHVKKPRPAKRPRTASPIAATRQH